MEIDYLGKENRMVIVQDAGDSWWDKINYDLAKKGIGIWFDGDIITSGGIDKLLEDAETYETNDVLTKIAQALAEKWHDHIDINDMTNVSDEIESINGKNDLLVVLKTIAKNDPDFSLRETWINGKQAIIWIFEVNEVDWDTFAKNEHLSNDIFKSPNINNYLEDIAYGSIYKITVDETKYPIFVGTSLINTKYDGSIFNMVKDKYGVTKRI